MKKANRKNPKKKKNPKRKVARKNPKKKVSLKTKAARKNRNRKMSLILSLNLKKARKVQKNHQRSLKVLIPKQMKILEVRTVHQKNPLTATTKPKHKKPITQQIRIPIKTALRPTAIPTMNQKSMKVLWTQAVFPIIHPTSNPINYLLRLISILDRILTLPLKPKLSQQKKPRQLRT